MTTIKPTDRSKEAVLKTFEALCHIKTIEIGQLVTEKQFNALDFLLGAALKTIKPFEVKITFKDDGTPIVDDPAGVIKSVITTATTATVIDKKAVDELTKPKL